MTKFYLGTHRTHWLNKPELAQIPLFISHRLLRQRKNLKQATTSWALDSGGFTELSLFGEWTITPHSYAATVQKYINEIGSLDWASIQDWMCEPQMLKATGKTISEHQTLTIRSLLDLRTISPDLPFIPVLQGWTLEDYLRHAEQYEKHGIELEKESIVGIGSICRRQATSEAAEIAQALQPLKLHAFGAKRDALGLYGSLLTSADSMAWSYAGRKRPDPNCPKKTCNNCLHYALQWRTQALNPTRRTLWSIA